MTKDKPYRPWLLVAGYSLLGISFPAAVTQFTMFVPEMAAALEVDTRLILLADSLRAVCLVAAMFLSGPVYRKLGRRRTICLGVLFQTLPQFLLPAAVQFRSVPFFFIFKAMQGCNAVAFPVYLSTITACVPPGSAGLATAIFNGSFTAGAGIGAWLSGISAPLLGFRWTFYSLGILCLIFALPALYLTGSIADDNGTGRATNKEKKQEGIYAAVIRRPILWFLILALSANTWLTQSVTVDMPVYLDFSGISKILTGNLMLAISMVIVAASVCAGAFSDFCAARSGNPVRTRALILAGGYALSAAAAVLFTFVPGKEFHLLALCACLMVFGSAWAAGVFWALPSMFFSGSKNLGATAFCSGASNIVNPVAPLVTGVLLGSAGYWQAGWLVCGIISLVSLAAGIVISRMKGQPS
ncbi:MAG: MFS transporter [Treponema sp.]|jgi:predicted MFS family arabinose efflux permease|nr:MFS transporter [Treponema sp.]